MILTKKVEPILKNLTINKKNQLVGNDHVIYGHIDEASFWHFYFVRKSGQDLIEKKEHIESVTFDKGIITITYTTGRKPLQFTKNGKLKSTDTGETSKTTEEPKDKPVSVEVAEVEEPDTVEVEEEIEPYPDVSVIPDTPLAATNDKALTKLSGLIDSRLTPIKNHTFNQYDLRDSDGYQYGVFGIKDEVIHFHKWNGNYPKNGRIVTVADDLLSIVLTEDVERTVKVSWKDGRTGYFLGEIPKVANDQFEVVDELHYPPERMDVDAILKKYYRGRLAIRDFRPSVKLGGGWVEYNQSKHRRKILSESDEAVKQFYIPRLTNDEFKKYNYRIPQGEFDDIVMMLFNEEQQDTFLEYVQSTPWDGIDRMSTLHKAIGLSSTPFNGHPVVNPDEDDHYCKALVHMILVGAIQRHIRPFTQDYVPVIVGRPGCGKSTTLRALGGSFENDLQGWYTGVKGKISTENQGREFYRPQLGKSIVELVEIDGILKKTDTGFLKSFLDGSHARFNEKHEKGMREYPLTAFITGTTNYERFLVDNTGNRRFLIVYMTQQEDTPNRESLKNVDNFRYTNEPLYLKFHPEYVQQLYAQAYQEFLNDEPYDFYVDHNDPENIILKVQRKLNNLSLKKPEYMDLFVGFVRAKCEESYYLGCRWTDVKTEFSTQNKDLMTKFQFDVLFRTFRENPSMYGFSEYDTVRISKEVTARGYTLVDPDITEEFTKNYSDILDE